MSQVNTDFIVWSVTAVSTATQQRYGHFHPASPHPAQKSKDRFMVSCVRPIHHHRLCSLALQPLKDTLNTILVCLVFNFVRCYILMLHCFIVNEAYTLDLHTVAVDVSPLSFIL